MDAAAAAAPPPPPDTVAPRASLSHLAPGFEEHMARSLGVEPSQLTTLTLTKDTPPAYASILAYAALHEPRRLYLAQRSPYEPVALLEDEDSDEEGDAAEQQGAGGDGADQAEMRLISRRMLRDMRQSSDMQPGRGIREAKCRSYVPRVLFHLGECVLQWPPPPHLMPDAVRARHRELLQHARAATQYCSPPHKEVAPPNGVIKQPEPARAPPAARAATDARHDAEAELRHERAPDAQRRFKVFVAQYEMGMPVEDSGCSGGGGGTVTERHLLLATSGGVSALTAFMSGVVAWCFEKDRLRKHAHRCYELYRFRSEGGNGYWESQGHRHARALHTVVLADGQMDAIVHDVSNFLQPATRSWFAAHGIPHRRSYLFYGKPGTGKTSTVRALAGEFGLNCCFLSMTDAAFSNQQLFDALRHIPSNALLVLEDVDSLFHHDRSSKATPSLTFSGMLNALDGVASSDGVLTVMTTNHMERLESALIRGGRVDRRFYFDAPSEKQLQRLFLTFYKDAPPQLAAQFAAAVLLRAEGAEARSIATLQQMFVYFREQPPSVCVQRMDEFFEMHFPTPPHANNDSLYT